jgi:chromosome segregation ATPase
MRKAAIMFMFIFLAVPLVVMADTPAAGSPIQAQIDQINAQIKSVLDDLAQLYSQRSVLQDQVSTLRAQKHINGLNQRSQDLNAKLANEQKKNNTAKITELNNKLSLLAKEISIEQEILGLYAQLSDAHKNAQKDKAKDLEAQIKSKKAEINALYPPKPPLTTPVAQAAGNTGNAAAPAPKTEDPGIQAVLDQIKIIDDKISQDKQKLADLKKQKDALKLQLKGTGMGGK